MKATDLKVGSKVNCFWLGGNATVTEIKGNSVYFSCETPTSRLSNLNYKLSKKTKKMNFNKIQAMMNWNDEFKFQIV